MVTLLLALIWVLVSPLWLYCLIPLKDTVLENRCYISLLGVAALAAWAAERAPIPVAALVVLYAIRTIQRNRDWHSEMSFAATAFTESPANGRAQLNYATALQATGALKLAAGRYAKLIQSGAPEGGQAAANLASMRLLEGRVAETLEFLPNAIRTWPGFCDLHINLGVAMVMAAQILQTQKKPGDAVCLKEAVVQFNLALLLEPKHPTALRNRSRCLYVLGDKEKAAIDAEAAEKLDGQHLVFQ